jgi:hypothetical protein
MPKPKFQLGDRARVNDAGPVDYRGRIFVITGIGATPSVYQIEDVHTGHSAGYLPAAWLDPIQMTSDEKTRQAVDEALAMLRSWSNSLPERPTDS